MYRWSRTATTPTFCRSWARVSEDITATFPGAQVFIAEAGDYRYRARVNRQEVANRLHDAVMEIDYDSAFKDVALSTSPPNAERFRAMYGCWEALAEMQDYRPYSTVPRSEESQSWEDDWDEEDL